MSERQQVRRVFVLHLCALSHVGDPYQELRLALKRLLHAHDFRCLSV
jgi:hypothetical protein